MLEDLFKDDEHRQLFRKHRISEPIKDEILMRLYQNTSIFLEDIFNCFDENFKNVRFDNLMDFIHKLMIICEEKFDFLEGKEKKQIVIDVLLLIILIHIPVGPVAQGFLYIGLYYTLPKIIDQLAQISKKINIRRRLRKLFSCCIPKRFSTNKRNKLLFKKIKKEEIEIKNMEEKE